MQTTLGHNNLLGTTEKFQELKVPVTFCGKVADTDWGCEDMYTLKQKQDIQLGKTVLLGFGVDIDFYMWKGS